MRSAARTWWQYGLNSTRNGANVPRPSAFRQGLRGGILWAAMAGLGMCGVSSAFADTGTVTPAVAIARVDPGPKPRIEDYPELIDYLMALLRWLYAVNGGDPADLDRLALGKVAVLVETQYLAGLVIPLSPEEVEEARAAAASLTEQAISGKVSLTERLKLLAAAVAVNAALAPVGSSQ